MAAASASAPAPVRSQQGPKPSKPDTFSSGKESGSAAAWLFSQRLYFEATNTADEYKVPFAVTFLRGSAALWWQAHLRQCVNGIVARLATWDSAEFLTQFAPINSVKVARDAIRSLIQTRSVQEYIDKFQTLVLQIPDMSAAEQLDKFTAVIHEKVEIEGCTTLAAMRVAQRNDTIHHHHQQQQQLSRSAASSSPSAIPSDTPTPMDLNAMRQSNANSYQHQPFRQEPRLTPAERLRHVNQNRCFKCHRVGHSWKQCGSQPIMRR